MFTGNIDGKEEETLMHDLQHDVDHLTVAVAPSLDGTGGASLRAMAMADVGKFVRAPLQRTRSRPSRVMVAQCLLLTQWLQLTSCTGARVQPVP